MAKAAQADAQQALGFLLDVGATSRVTKQDLLAKNVTPALTSAVGSVPDQSPQEAASQAGALFGALSQAVADSEGASTGTAVTQLTGKLGEFFSKLDETRTIRADELKKLTDKQQVTERESLQIKQAQFRLDELKDELASIGTPRTKQQEREKTEVQLKVKDAELDLADAIQRSGLTDKETERLAELKKQTQELAKVSDPGTIEGRIKALQSAPALRREFLQNVGGEAAYQEPIRQLFTPGSALFQTVEKNISQIDFARDTFLNAAAETTKGITREAAIAIQSVKAQADKEIRQSDPTAAAKGLIEKTTLEALRDTRLNNAYALVDPLTEKVGQWAIQSAGTVKLSGDRARELLLKRRESIGSDLNLTGVLTPSDRTKIRALDRAIARINEIESAATGHPLAQQPQVSGSLPLIEAVDKFGEAVDRFSRVQERPIEINDNRPGADARAQANSGVGPSSM